MNIALAIYRLVPSGGLERHAIRIAAALAERGHRVTLYTTAGTEAAPAGVEAVRFDVPTSTNHGALAAFSERLRAASRGRHDLIVGFQRLPGLDVLFCADWCYVDRQRPWIARQLPRYRTMVALERACFGPDAKTRILLLSEPQRAAYAAAYPASVGRMTVLPPTVDPRQRAPAATNAAERAALRAQHDLPQAAIVWLWIGLQPQVKGLDRVIYALAQEPRAILIACGVTASRRQVAALLAQARRQGFADRIRIMGMVAEQDLHPLFALSDLLVHPARLDVTGMVILEAMAHGLPVITTANCGFSTHVAAAAAGVVLPVPFEQAALTRALAGADAEQRARWARHAFAYSAEPTLYSGLERACDLIEAAAHAKGAARPA